MIFVSLSLSILLGASLSAAILSYFFQCQWMEFTWKFWAILACFSALGLGTSLYFFFHEKKKQIHSQLQTELDKFQKEFKLATRGHLKASILFWIHFYRKEKVKTLEDAKKEIFHDLKREFSSIPWMQTLLEDIRHEISRYR